MKMTLIDAAIVFAVANVVLSGFTVPSPKEPMLYIVCGAPSTPWPCTDMPQASTPSAPTDALTDTFTPPAQTQPK